MGRSVTPRYALWVDIDGGYVSPMAWRVRSNNRNLTAYGKPTPANIAKWVETFEASSRPGGCNAHLGPQVVLRAEVVDQYNDNRVVAEWHRPMSKAG